MPYARIFVPCESCRAAGSCQAARAFEAAYDIPEIDVAVGDLLSLRYQHPTSPLLVIKDYGGSGLAIAEAHVPNFNLLPPSPRHLIHPACPLHGSHQPRPPRARCEHLHLLD